MINRCRGLKFASFERLLSPNVNIHIKFKKKCFVSYYKTCLHQIMQLSYLPFNI